MEAIIDLRASVIAGSMIFVSKPKTTPTHKLGLCAASSVKADLALETT